VVQSIVAVILLDAAFRRAVAGAGVVMGHLAAPCAATAPKPAAVIEVEGVVTRFGSQTVHDGVSLRFRPALVALIGGSGTGKSVLLREMIGLQRPTAGCVRLLGTDVWTAPAPSDAVRRRFGMMFQDGALFSSLDGGAERRRAAARAHDFDADHLIAAGGAAAAAGRAAGRRRRQDAQRAVGRHAQARRHRTRHCARARGAVPRRTDLGTGPDHRARVRPPGALAGRRTGDHRVSRHPRSGHAADQRRPAVPTSGAASPAKPCTP
jgi:hypothetical protein